MADTMRDRAVRLARQGFRVFKLDVFSKIPAVDNWPELATDDVNKVAASWTCNLSGESLDNNIGVATGDGLLVLDVDTKDGKQGDSSLGYLVDFMGLETETLTVATPSGGRHLYFKIDAPVRNSAGGLAPGLDVRGHHGFVVGPGSETGAGVYAADDSPIAAAPKWFVDLCGRPREKIGQKIGQLVEADSQAAIDRAIAYLQTDAPTVIEGAGGDFATYKVACRLKDFGVSEPAALDLMLIHWNADRALPPWQPDELERKIANAYAYGQNPIGSASPEAEFDIVNIDVDAPRGMSTRGRLKPMSESLFNPASRYLIDGLLDEQGVSVFSAKSGRGKSFVALDLAYHIAAGREWNRRKVRQGCVLYYATEGWADLDDRMTALRAHHGADVPVFTVRVPLSLAPGSKDHAAIAQDVLEAEALSGLKCRLMVVDTLSRATGGLGESDNTEMTTFMNCVRDVAERSGVHAMLVHHWGKDESRGSRGAYAITACADVELWAQEGTSPESATRFGCSKQRAHGKPNVENFKLREVPIGRRTEDNQMMHSCVINWVDEDLEPKQASAGEKQMHKHLAALTGPRAEDDNAVWVSEKEWDSHAKLNWEINKHAAKGNSIRTKSEPVQNKSLAAFRRSLLQLGWVRKNKQNQWTNDLA